MRKIDLIVIHCSATREDRAYTPEQLQRDHIARGFDGAGYNYYIRRSGELVEMRPLQKIPAHAKGYNWHSIGICYEGGLDMGGQPADTRTPGQKETLRRLLCSLLQRFGECEICGHRDLSPDVDANGQITPEEWIKACPCFDARTEYSVLRQTCLP